MTEEAWRWICGVLVAGNAAQYVAAQLKDKQGRSDLMAMLPVLADVKSTLADVVREVRK